MEPSINKSARSSYQFGSFLLDPAEHMLLRDGEPVSLRPKEFAVLLALVESHGHVLTKDALLKGVWPDQFVEEGNINRHISTLRKVLGKTDPRQFVETVPKVGYRFVARVECLDDQSSDIVMERHSTERLVTEEEDLTDSQIESEPVLLSSSANVRTPNCQRRLTLVFVGLMTIVAVTLILGSSSRRSSSARVRLNSLAVLPFKPIGADEEDQYLGLGMTDALITKLSNVREVNIRPTSAVRKYESTKLDPLAVGRELRVEAVLEGSVQRIDDQIRVNIQLVSVRDRRPLWAETFDEHFTNIFAVQDRISEKVAQALMLELSVEDRARLHKRHTENPAAYQAYLKGRFFWNKRTGESIRKGIEYFEQAVRIDPNYALAHAGLADSYNVLSQLGKLSPDAAMPKAKVAALMALKLDDSLAEAHASLALVNEVYDWNWSGAEAEFKRAIELNPNNATTHHWYAMLLSAMGQHEHALAEIRRAKELDPVSLIINTNEGWILFCARQYDAAIEQLRKTIDLDPSFGNAHYKLALVYEQKGRFKEAVAEFLENQTLAGLDQKTVALLKNAYSTSGWQGYGHQELKRLHETAKTGYVSPKYFVLSYLEVGDKERVFEWLEKAYSERGEVLLYLKVDPRFDLLRQDPRFEDLLRRVGHAS